MNAITRVAVAGAVLAVLGGFLLGRVVAEESSLPDVGDPVTVGSTAEPTPSADPPTLRPRPDRDRDPGRVSRPGDDRTDGPREDGDDDDDNRGPGSVDDDSGSDDGDSGRGRGRGRGGDDDEVRTVGPSPSEIDDDDDNSGPGSDDDDSGGDDD